MNMSEIKDKNQIITGMTLSHIGRSHPRLIQFIPLLSLHLDTGTSINCHVQLFSMSLTDL